MKLGSYTGHYTPYRRQWFRSQLEVAWAIFFHKLGWAWTYEAERLGCWLPDFQLGRENEPVYVEIKPIQHVGEELAQETMTHIEVSSVRTGQQVLLCGERPFLDFTGHPCVGWSWRRGDGDGTHYRPAFLVKTRDGRRFGLMTFTGDRLGEVLMGAERRDLEVALPGEAEFLWRSAKKEAQRIAHDPWSMDVCMDAWALDLGAKRLMPPGEDAGTIDFSAGRL